MRISDWSSDVCSSDLEPGIVVVDVRGPDKYTAGHVPGAISIPYRKIIESKMAAYPAETLFVVYCDGVHCNGATRGAIRLAALGRPVKKMVGGLHGWELDGFALERSRVSPAPSPDGEDQGRLGVGGVVSTLIAGRAQGKV